MVKKLVLGLTLLSFAGRLLAADAFTGTWKLNVAKSKFAPGTEVKELTVVVAEQGANLAVTATGTAGDGKPILSEIHISGKRRSSELRGGRPCFRGHRNEQESECQHEGQYKFSEWERGRQHSRSRQR